MKVHAKDYLVELACSKGTPVWLSYIIYGVLRNGDLSEESLKKFLGWFENNQGKEFDKSLIDSLTNKHADGREIKLIKLIHHSGVNALTCDGEIKFCKDITVLYGGNGSGKSGYFRILNEVIGGGVPHQILPNVYEQGKPISVTLEYETNGQVKSLHWTGERGDGSNELDLKVFDGYYASTLISRRTIDMAAVEPLGLHLFGLVTEKIDCFKRIVSDQINVLIKQLPHIDTSNLSEDIRSLVENKLLTRQEYNKRVAPIEFTIEDDRRLAVIQSRIIDLQQQDVQPTIRYKQLIRNTLSSIKQELKRQVQQLEASVEEWNKVLSQYAATYNAAKSARGQYSVLNGIPGSDSDLWKQFIQNGVEYSRQYEQEYSERCPYCHQSLKNDLHAIDLVKGYVAFLTDKSQRQCELEWANLQKLQNRIKAFGIGCAPLQTLAQVVAGRDSENFSRMQQRIENYVASLHKGKLQLDTDVGQLRVTAVSVMQDECAKIEMQLTAEMSRIDEELTLLTNGALARTSELGKLKEEQSLLFQRKEVVRLKPQLNKFCGQIDALSHWNKFYASISSRRISDLSRVAHNDLLTEKLQKRFAAWFGQFGFKDLKISLEVVSALKSIPQTELRITGVDKAIPLVLSEGEQKAAALAMFLAETEMQCDSTPLVFDDPVNSLDHRVIAAFAHMLLTVNRQIVVFSVCPSKA